MCGHLKSWWREYLLNHQTTLHDISTKPCSLTNGIKVLFNLISCDETRETAKRTRKILESGCLRLFRGFFHFYLRLDLWKAQHELSYSSSKESGQQREWFLITQKKESKSKIKCGKIFFFSQSPTNEMHSTLS